MAFFRLIPNLTIMAPKDFKELEDMMEFAVNVGKPVVIRYPRGGEGKEKFNQHKKIEYQKAEILKEGKDVSIFAIGNNLKKSINTWLVFSVLISKTLFSSFLILILFSIDHFAKFFIDLKNLFFLNASSLICDI